MNEIILNLIVIGATLVIIAVIFILVRKNKKQEEEKIALLAKQKGWQLEMIREPLANGFVIATPYWRLESVARSLGRESGPGSSDIALSTTWTANQPGSTLLVGPKTSQVNLGIAFDMLIKQVIFTALGEDASSVNEVHMGTPAFQKQFMVWAENDLEADKLLTPAVQSALLNWENVKPLIKRTSQGLTIELQNFRVRKPEEVEALVRLGEMLL